MGLDISDLPDDHPMKKAIIKAGGEELLKPSGGKKRQDHEHKLQVDAVDIFRLAFPKLKRRLFAVPNGGARNAITGAKLKAEGVMAGVWDMFLACPRGKFAGCFIETKFGDNDLSESQERFKKELEGEYFFFVYRNVAEFIEGVTYYLNLNSKIHTTNEQEKEK